jgi:hypothetical protein
MNYQAVMLEEANTARASYCINSKRGRTPRIAIFSEYLTVRVILEHLMAHFLAHTAFSLTLLSLFDGQGLAQSTTLVSLLFVSAHKIAIAPEGAKG